MISFPNAKINIGLHITGKRPDGFHDLQTIFYPVAIKDALEIVEADHFSFSSSGIKIEDKGDNLCVKAYDLIKKDHPTLPAVKIHLHKAIPIGAGLGGGSADAAFCLQLINEKFHLDISQEQLMRYALELGSDCPFFLVNKPCVATGRGEVLQPIELDLSPYDIVIINPGIHINTGQAFAQIKSYSPPADLEKTVAQPVAQWEAHLYNDFEKIIFPAHPALEKIKKGLYQSGALYAAMSGSGSSMYGIFSKGTSPALDIPAEYFSRWL